MTHRPRIGFLGGTLDPIHLGHVEAACAARDALSLERVEIVPAHVPPHRHQQPRASAFHRFAMAALAVSGVDRLAVNDLELTAPGPSFTAETLSRLRDGGLSSSQIFFITGADAFAEIETWRRYPEVLELAQFVVIARPGSPLESLPSRLPALAGRMTRGVHPPAPGTSAIFLVDVRTPDVSSTDIRRRIASGEPLAGLLPPAVEAHIVQHGLYGMPRAHA